MNKPRETSGFQLRSLIKENGELELSLVKVVTPLPHPEEVVVLVEAAPINPSDVLLLLAGADLSTMRRSGSMNEAVLCADIPPAALNLVTGRIGLSLTIGNEAAGTVIAAGESEAAQALLGKTVAIFGGSMFAQYRSLKATDCLVLPEDTTPAQGAAAHVNPLTALGIVETVRREGHSAFVHTAAASALGQILNKICVSESIDLVNIVRSTEQENILRSLGARYICNSASPKFEIELTEAITATNARLAFDAIGGGNLAGQILDAMHVASSRNASTYSRYGSPTQKQIYTYGNFDPSPTMIDRKFGMAWGIAGWALPIFLEKIGPAETNKLKTRIAAEIKTTFACHFSKEISLYEALQPENVAAYSKKKTGEKFLINPTRG